MSRARPAGTSRVLLGIALVFLISLGGCGLFTKADPTVERSTPPEQAGVTLLDAGAEPHRALRYAYAAGDTVDLDVAIDLHVTQTVPGQDGSQVADPPATIQTMRVTVLSADSDSATIAFEVIDVRLDPDGTQLTDPEIEKLTIAIRQAIGLGGTIEVDPSGALLSVEYEGLGEDGDQTMFGLEQTLISFLAPLPAEPIGRGARWRSVARGRPAGTTLRQVTEYEITALDGDQVTYRATIHQSTPEQTLGDITGWRILAADLTGTASGRLSTTRLATESETILGGTQLLEVDDPAKTSNPGPIKVTQALDLTVTVTPVTSSPLDGG